MGIRTAVISFFKRSRQATSTPGLPTEIWIDILMTTVDIDMVIALRLPFLSSFAIGDLEPVHGVLGQTRPEIQTGHQFRTLDGVGVIYD
jgi:hypothetical protein